MAMSCGQVGRLSVASAGGHATEAERLELEAHFATCARCAAEHAIVLGATRVLRSAEPGTLSSAARERVRRAALAGRAHAPWRRGASAGRWRAARCWRWRRPSRFWIGVRKPAEIAVVAGDALVVPELAAGGHEPSGDGVVVRSERGGEVKLADASAALARTTELVVAPRQARRRAAGRIADRRRRPPPWPAFRGPHAVLHRRRRGHAVPGRSWRVRTERGKVRVRTRDGIVIGYLDAGQSWRWPPPTRENAHEDEPAPAPTETPAPPTQAPAIGTAAIADWVHHDGASLYHTYQWVEGERGAVTADGERVVRLDASRRARRVRTPRALAAEATLLGRLHRVVHGGDDGPSGPGRRSRPSRWSPPPSRR